MIKARVPEEYLTRLNASPTMAEVKDAFHGLSSGKSPGPDGSSIDSIMMLQELVQSYHKMDGVSKTAIKIDLQKAYDMVEWENLWLVMETMGFPRRFMFLVQRSVMTATFSVHINGTLKGCWSFVDMVIVVTPSEKTVKVVMECLLKFGNITGLKLNCSKSKIFFGSMKAEEKEKVAWRTLCLPLEEGGLGFKCYSIWAYKEALLQRDVDPWYWKKLLKSRTDFRLRLTEIGRYGGIQLTRSSRRKICGMISKKGLREFLRQNGYGIIKAFLGKLLSHGCYFWEI
ncbi:hypothetical protein LIER_37948 [Lithospermum erythrorhizon]|uniref:Reverse transcriptase domain-containing protein n=1 Tax=Lithospermum erythrorhizon TaxID=34254 RepID=A0AAV3PUW2_LITER